MGAFRDLTGNRYGRLLVVERHKCAGKVKWNCICACGGKTIAQTAHLVDGRRVSCGCAKLPGNQVNPKVPHKHGHCVNGKSTKLYRIWSGVFTRCTNTNSKAYKYYGARGIKVCDRWKDFKLFLEDMGDPDPGQSLDRIDVNGDYEPNNCRWASAKEQARNKRNNFLIKYKGITKTLSEWSEESGINRATLWSRIKTHGWCYESSLENDVLTHSEIAYRVNYKRWGYIKE